MIMHKRIHIHVVFIVTVAAAALLFGCGGGGGGGTASTGSISGTAIKGPVSGATVTAFAVGNGMPGAQIAHGTTDAQGNFTMTIGSYSGPVLLQMTGGTYTDEASGTTMTMTAGNVMSVAIPSVSSGATVTGIQMTPLTSMAQLMANAMSGGMTPINIAAANTAVGDYFMVSDILHTQPMNPLVAGSGAGASQGMRNYGLSIAAMSQEAEDLGMASSSNMVTAMVNDASDGVMNGLMGNSQIPMDGMMGGGTMMQATSGTSGLADAMITFMTSTVNQSGLTASDMQGLIDRLASSNGTILGPGGTATAGMVSGTAFNGPVQNAMISAYSIDNGSMGAQLASGATDTQGSFSLPLGDYSGSVMLQITGGTYTDLATGATMTISAGNVMTAVIPSMATGASVTGIQITPLTSMAQERAQYMTGGMTASNISAANVAVGDYFMVNDVLHTRPIDPLIPASGTGTTVSARNYGMTIAAMLQYAQNIGMAEPSAIVTAMASDASDGVMDGMMGGTGITMGGMGGGMMGGATKMQPTAGTSGLAAAMTDFAGSAENRSGLTATDMQTLIDKLSASNGTIQ